MTVTEGPFALLETDEPGPSTGEVVSGRRRTLRRLYRNRAAMVALVYLVVIVLMAVLAPLIAPHDPDEQDLVNAFATPSSEHWLGTDDLGRDLLSRLMYGARISLWVSFAVVALGLVVAVPFGLVAGYRGGRVDAILMRLCDAGLSFPPLVLALAVAGVLGPGTNNVVLALSIVFVPGLIRLVRGAALVVRTETFIEASRTVGTPTRRILVRRVFPNIRSPLIVQASFALGAALLAEAGLSYLGLGPRPPAASWGNMLRRAYDSALFTHAWQLMIPGAAIALTVLAFNTVSDGLRDALGASRRERIGKAERRGLTTVARDRPHISVAREPAATAPLLHVDGLGVEFTTDSGTARVVDDVHLTINKGEVVGLVGESGSGKTVTALSIMRLIPSPPGRIASGAIRFEGTDLLSLSLKEMRRIRGTQISMIFQDPMTSLDPAYTVGNQLVEAHRVHEGVSKATAQKRALELLDLVGIPAPRQRLSEYPHQLSGGMRQRVMIAIALVGQPKLLIADEPTTALDVTVQAQILDLLRQLQREFHMAVLFVTHDLGVIADLSDRVAVMYAGQIVDEAPVDQLFAQPHHPYTEGLLGAMPQVGRREDRLTVIPGQVPLPAHMPTGCRFNPRCPYAETRCTTTPTSLDEIDAGVRTRCLRHEELTLRGAS